MVSVSPDAATSTDSRPVIDEDGGVHAPGLNYFVFALFFIFGGITSLNDVIIPKLKELFTLSYTEAMLVQFCFFTAYLLIGIPGAKLVKKIGYMRGAVAGLVTMMAGCLLFIPASQTATYPVFLLALFVLASGVVVVQVVANPLISMLGPQRTAHSRLTFAQAFNSLGTTVFPIVGTIVILGSLATVTADQLSGVELQQYRQEESAAIWKGYLGLTVLIGIVAAAVWAFRKRLPHDAKSMGESKLVSWNRYAIGIAIVLVGGLVAINRFGLFEEDQVAQVVGLLIILGAPILWLFDNDLLKRTRFGYGALSIFLYVGAEVAIGSIIVNYLMQESVLGLPESEAGKLIAVYWGGAMVGRFIGSGLLRIFSPGKILAFNCLGAIALITVSMMSTGEVAGYSLLAVGLMNSIMFPTIFSLACEKLGPRAADGSGIINIAIFGGAVVPVVFGMVADATSLSSALVLPIICYAIIMGFGIFARRPA
ncbi:sugar MFS transporter [Sphingomicrobium aestuariivivum]|uniref:sugar MFS transporter n=1 Tax=Sphingomicrobium aestuariivivum TaxID=1582356 RepID=UPI001FD66EB5|nr:sugar MFS transporter [Sphingomicrobium aestuariivivum]MCJ8190899.1 sugar MFS transporter [Sphingomicrobium aestuariivivum]